MGGESKQDHEVEARPLGKIPNLKRGAEAGRDVWSHAPTGGGASEASGSVLPRCWCLGPRGWGRSVEAAFRRGEKMEVPPESWAGLTPGRTTSSQAPAPPSGRCNGTARVSEPVITSLKAGGLPAGFSGGSLGGAAGVGGGGRDSLGSGPSLLFVMASWSSAPSRSSPSLSPFLSLPLLFLASGFLENFSFEK